MHFTWSWMFEQVEFWQSTCDLCWSAPKLFPSSPALPCASPSAVQPARREQRVSEAKAGLGLSWSTFHINCCVAVCAVKLRKGWGVQSGGECKMHCAGIIRKRKLFNSTVVLESWYSFIFTILTGQLDRSSVYSWSSGSASEQLRHICVIHWHTYSLFSKSYLIYANVPLSMCDRGKRAHSDCRPPTSFPLFHLPLHHGALLPTSSCFPPSMLNFHGFVVS